MKLQKLLRNANVAVFICDELVGRKHSRAHRILVGIAVMLVGVAVAKVFQHTCSHEVVLTFGEALAGAIHGIGLTPIIEAIADKFESV